MASRILSGGPLSKGGERRTASTLPRPSAGNKTQPGGGGTGVGGTTAGTSRLPQSAGIGLFSRGRAKSKAVLATKAAPSSVAVPAQPSKQSTAQAILSPKGIGNGGERVDLSPDAHPMAASSIPRGLAPGMGVTTHISSSGTASTKVTSLSARPLPRKLSLNNDRYARSESGTSSDGAARDVVARQDPKNRRDHADQQVSSVLGITISEPEGTTYTPISRPDYSTPTEYQTSNTRMELYMSRRLPHKLSTQNLPPPAASHGNSSSARDNSSTSSRFTETPSPFSRISTPNTAVSSYSPSGAAPKLTPPRLRPSASPTRNRPPVVRRKIPGSTPIEDFTSGFGLDSVRENREASHKSSSSSSNSTIKASELLDTRSGKAILSGRLDRKAAPTAPLRLSSKCLPKPPLADDAETSHDPASENMHQTAVTTGERRQSRLPTTGVKSPPLRPSRHGAPAVAGLEQTSSPVIQSNLSHLATTGHTRRESLERNMLASPDRSENASPRRPVKSPSKDLGEAAPPAAGKRSRSISRRLPSVATDAPQVSRSAPSPASTAPSTRSRFGLFSRRLKLPEEVILSGNRKGPVAGTGHEAYGKFGKPARGRSGSVSSNGSGGKSASPSGRPARTKSRQDSFTSNEGGRPEPDDFFEQRLRPVVISGGGAIKNNRNSQGMPGASIYASSSAQSSLASIGSSVVYDRKTTVTGSESSASMISATASDNRASRSLLPAPKITAKAETSLERTLAHRRSQQRVSQGDQGVKIPAPINVQMVATRPVLDSRDTAQSSIPETGSILSSDLSESAWMKSGSSRAKSKSRMKSPSRWGNFFSRNRSRSPKKRRTPTEPALASITRLDPVNVSIADVGNRFVGHYAMLDDEGLSTDERDIEDVLKNIEEDLDLRDENGDIITNNPEEHEPRQVSMLLPSPPKLNAEFPRFVQPTPISSAFSPVEPSRAVEEKRNEPDVKRRPSRLQRVGRIPQSNQHTHRPNQSSFSRPFDASGRPSLEDGRVDAVHALHQSPSRPKLTLQTDRLPQTSKVEQWRQATYATAPPTNAFLHNLDGEQEFMSFTPERQQSQVSGSSSSGNTSFINMNSKSTAEVIQRRTDELWNESEEFDESFDLDSPEGTELLNAFPSLINVRRTPPNISPETKEMPDSFLRQGNSSRKSVSPPLPEKPDHLALPPHLHPATRSFKQNGSLETYFKEGGLEYSRLKRVSDASSNSESRYSSQTTISSSSHVSALLPSQVNQVTRAMARKTRLIRDSLRFSALMTSRWLSFDRVLFSPVAEDILSLTIQSPRILILDGLANDDWSAYTALSYPNATIYNLSTTPKLRTPSPHGDEWANPPNHKLLPLPSTAHPFPFPKGFFAAVVVRFPPLLPQNHLGNIIAEAKRVLRPGGYLEMTLLDIDPVNLGPKTRHEVKRVKMCAQERMPDAGLAPVGDATMKLLARRGFEGLRNATLGVPVATSPDSDAIEGPGSKPFNEDRASDSEADRPRRSLGDLLREAGDESGAGIALHYPVTQTIGRVARWWWSRCYEGLINVNGNDERATLLGLRGRGEEDGRSMWADPAILEECKERETSLRLILAYAVKPMVARRRTTSV